MQEQKQEGTSRFTLTRSVLFALLFWGAISATWWLSNQVGGRTLNLHEKARLDDLGQLDTYISADASLASDPTRVVFLGDSITYFWQRSDLFQKPNYVGRGIEGQTSSDMLVRFREDVIDLHPDKVVILAGINDFAEAAKSGRAAKDNGLNELEANYQTFAELAELHHIRPIFISILPVNPQAPRARKTLLTQLIKPVRSANQWMKSFCFQHQYVYVDEYDALADGNGLLRSEFSTDGIHPNQAGYKAMSEVFSRATQSEAAAN